ncbi:MAG: hypothetical protein P8Y69_06295 [Gammaproteobacteria bacterium]|jgi:hypothetical protein
MTVPDEVAVRPLRTVRWRIWLVCVAGLLHGQPALPHGSVVDEADQCLMSIGFYRAHFTIFQPRAAGHTEYCEDLPATGETVFVINYLHETMREVPVDFRIVRDRNGIGRFARYEDVLALDLETDTVFYQPPVVHPDAVFTAMYDFARPGGYIGVVTVAHPTTDEVYRAVFPFEVGVTSWDYVAWGGPTVGALGVGLWWWAARRRRTGNG